MKRTFLAAGASALALALAAPAFAQDTATEAAAPAVVDPDFMVWPAMGFDPADLDPSLDPGDDFADYVNGKWDATNPIPPQFVTYGVSRDLYLKAQEEVRKIVAESAAAHAPAGSFEQKVGDTYAAYLDTDAIEAKGLEPLYPMMTAINAISTREELAKAMAMPGMPDPLGFSVFADLKVPTMNGLYFSHGGYTLPDRDNYLVDTEKNREMQAKQKEYQAFLLGKAGYADPEQAAEAVFQLEKKLASVDFDRTLMRNPELGYNALTRGELVGLATDFPLQTYLDTVGLGEADKFIVETIEPTAEEIEKFNLSAEDLAKLKGGMPGFLKLLGDVPLTTWQAWMNAHLLSSYASILPKEFDDASFAFKGTYLSGQKVQRPREQRALSAVNGTLGEAVGKLYVERNFSPEAKAEMKTLVANLLTAMDERISSLSWMSPETKAQAHDKLSKFTVKIGYPDEFETYEGLEVVSDDPVANAIEAGKWGLADTLKDVGQPVDRGEWLMTPQTVNAYYMPPANEIVFPAAYLQAPNFSLTADPAVNYGSIGATIGHEISHGFDDKGSMYDGDGVLRNWWTEQDRAKFDVAAKNLVNQFNAYCPIDDGKTCVNGQLTLGENIADLAGIAIAYDAYKASLNGEEAPIIDGLTGDQRFFISYAISYRGKWTEELTRNILQTDPHSPDKARINIILSNFDPWYEAFGVTEDDDMYIAPENRVRIW